MRYYLPRLHFYNYCFNELLDRGREEGKIAPVSGQDQRSDDRQSATASPEFYQFPLNLWLMIAGHLIKKLPKIAESITEHASELRYNLPI